MIQRGNEKRRERGYWRRGAGEKLIECNYERLMRTGNEKKGDRSNCLFSLRTRGNSDQWGENKHELAH